VKEKCTYAGPFLLWMGLLMFLGRMGSRRSLNYELDTPEALANLNALAGVAAERVADEDTLAHYLGHVVLEDLGRPRRKMVYRLIRSKGLEDARLFGHYLIVLDGTGHLTFRERHCPQCLEWKSNGQTYYIHYVLEAKLVTPGGLALSVGTEFVENAGGGEEKQDCERKAFQRLAPRLKQHFLRLPICLLLDALHAHGGVLDLCEDYGWKYLIGFKEGSLPAVWEEYESLRKQTPENRRACRPEPRCTQEFAWVNGLEFTDDRKRRHRFDAFQCEEDDHGEKRFFAWITNFAVRAETVAALGNRGGRLRWKIENEGFNIQKNGGFNLEHAYTQDSHAAKAFYLILQIAHLIAQLLERGRVLGENVQKIYGSFKKFAQRLLESLRYVLLPPEALDPQTCSHFQLRLNTS
jgi:hypothetical protein